MVGRYSGTTGLFVTSSGRWLDLPLASFFESGHRRQRQMRYLSLSPACATDDVGRVAVV